MIYQLTGTIVEKKLPSLIIINCSSNTAENQHSQPSTSQVGIGYGVHIPLTLFCNISLGEQHCIHTQLIIREDEHTLFGFTSTQERDLFNTLIKTNGIGPKSGLAILSTFNAAQLQNIIAHEDITQLTKIPGIGKKTAERLMLELKDKLKGAISACNTNSEYQLKNTNTISDNSLPTDCVSDAEQALLALGFNTKEATRKLKLALKKLENENNIATEILVKEALQM